MTSATKLPGEITLMSVGPYFRTDHEAKHALERLRIIVGPNCRLEEQENLESLTTWAKDRALPHLIVMDKSVNTNPKLLKNTLAGIKRLDPAIVVLLMTSESPNSLDIMNFLDLGITGLLDTSFDAAHFSDAIMESIEKRIQYQIARKPRAPASHTIEVRIKSIEQALVTETLNLGTGGMFVRMDPRELEINSIVGFKLFIDPDVTYNDITSLNINSPAAKQSDSEAMYIEGEGRIAWIRNHPTSDMPEGVGIQFTELSRRSESVMADLVTSLRMRAFIPKN